MATTSLRKFLSSFAVLAIVIALMPSPNRADTTYSYTGLPFISFTDTSCPPTCEVTGSFTIASPLAANITGMPTFTPLSFSFTDGSTTWTNINSAYSYFAVNTNAAGSIIDWDVNMFGPGGGGGIWTYFDGPSSFQEGVNVDSYQAYSSLGGGNAGGTWSEGTTVPEPSTSTLLCSGILLGLISPILKRVLG